MRKLRKNLREGWPKGREDPSRILTKSAEIVVDKPEYKSLEKAVKAFPGIQEDTYSVIGGENVKASTNTYTTGSSYYEIRSDSIVNHWSTGAYDIRVKDTSLQMEVATCTSYALVGITHWGGGVISPSVIRILSQAGLQPTMSDVKTFNGSVNYHSLEGYGAYLDNKEMTAHAPITAMVAVGSFAKIALILRNLKKKLDLVGASWDKYDGTSEEGYYRLKGLTPDENESTRIDLTDINEGGVIASSKESDRDIIIGLVDYINELRDANSDIDTDLSGLDDLEDFVRSWNSDELSVEELFKSFIHQLMLAGFDDIEGYLRIDTIKTPPKNPNRVKRLKAIQKNAERDAAHRFESKRRMRESFEDPIDEIVFNYASFRGDDPNTKALNAMECAGELLANGFTAEEVQAHFDADGYYDGTTGESIGSGTWDLEFANDIVANMK